VITFKCLADLGQLPESHPAHCVIKELDELLDDFPQQPYNADDYGYLVLVEPGDTDRELQDLGMPWRLAEVPWEGASLWDRFFYAVYLGTDDYDMGLVIPDAPWVNGELRQVLEEILDWENIMAKSKDPLDGIVKVLHSATCLSLSGKSNITYQIGADPESNIYLRIYGNTGGGFFSPEWVALGEVQKFIDAAPKDKPLSSWSLHPLFRGKSVNTPAFLMAAFVHEKWLRKLKGKKRGLEVLDEAPFMAKLEKLAAGKKATPVKKPAAKKAPAKKAPAKKPRKRAAV
jgi:hypothetical protein